MLLFSNKMWSYVQVDQTLQIEGLWKGFGCIERKSAGLNVCVEVLWKEVKPSPSNHGKECASLVPLPFRGWPSLLTEGSNEDLERHWSWGRPGIKRNNLEVVLTNKCLRHKVMGKKRTCSNPCSLGTFVDCVEGSVFPLVSSNSNKIYLYWMLVVVQGESPLFD